MLFQKVLLLSTFFEHPLVAFYYMAKFWRTKNFETASKNFFDVNIFKHSVYHKMFMRVFVDISLWWLSPIRSSSDGKKELIKRPQIFWIFVFFEHPVYRKCSWRSCRYYYMVTWYYKSWFRRKNNFILTQQYFVFYPIFV